MSSNYPRPQALWSGWTTTRVADRTAAAAFDADELLRTSIGSSLRRMMGTGAGTLVAFALSIFVPFVAGAALSTPQFAFWALLNTISSVALTLDFGAATMLPALLARDPSSHRAIIASGSALTALGSVVVGSLGMLAWWGMQPRLGVQGWGMRSGELALLGTTIGSVLRSVVQVVAAVALVGRKDVFRNALLVTQAACQAVFTCALLFVTHSAWALPLGLCISGALTAIVGVSCLERLRAALMQMTHAGDGR